MKTTLLSLATCFIGFGTMAQCVPTTGLTGSGFAFTSNQLSTVYACADCGDQERVISFKTFADTTISVVIQGNPPLAITVVADYFRVDSIGGLPAGLTFTTDAAFDTTFDAVENPYGYWINPGDTSAGFTTTTGCITIMGDAAAWTAATDGGPNSDGIYPLAIYIDVRAADFVPSAISGVVGYNTWLSDMGTLLPAFGDPNFTTNGIQYAGPSLEVVSSGVGINDQVVGNFGEVKNHPNPFTSSTTISFELKERTSNLQFAVYNVLGAVVSSKSINPTIGKNRITFASENLPSGVYVYTLSDGDSMVTRKMNIQ